MASRELVKYVQEYHSKGYSLATLRDFLVNQGYSPDDVDSAIHSAYSLEHMPKNRVFIVISVVAVLIISASFFFIVSSYLSGAPEVMMLKVYAGSEEVRKGEPFEFKVVLANRGSEKGYPVALRYELVRNGSVESVKEAVSDSEAGELVVSFVPKEVGSYSVRTVLSYGSFVNESTILFDSLPLCGDRVCDDGEVCTADCAGELCGDGVCSEGEDCAADCAGELCGDGVCGTKEVCPADCFVCGDGVCGEGEQCASDCAGLLCGNGVCNEGESYLNCLEDCEVPKSSCGNNVCDSGESTKSCPADCRYDTGINSMSSAQVRIYVAQKIPEAGERAVAKECLSAVEQQLKDECFKAVSKAVNVSAYCDYINESRSKDDCLMTYVYKTSDYEKCAAVKDDFVRKNCEYLRNYNPVYTAQRPLQ